MYRWGAALLVLGAACANETGGQERACTLIGCESGASFEVGAFAEAEVGRLTGARIEVCLNAMCREAEIEEVPAPDGIRYLSLGGGAPLARVTIARTDPGGAIEIEAQVSGEAELFADGDVYSVSLVGSDQTQLVERAWSVTYRISQPNGPECEPTCRTQDTTTEL